MRARRVGPMMMSAVTGCDEVRRRRLIVALPRGTAEDIRRALFPEFPAAAKVDFIPYLRPAPRTIAAVSAAARSELRGRR